LDVIDHEIELMVTVRITGVNGDFGGRKAEDEPAFTDVYESELENVAQERTIGIRVGAVDDRMRANDH
jgi:hypothetical protein